MTEIKSMQINFQDIHYLSKGTEKQRKAYVVLVKYQLMEKLSDFDPILVGTIPICIDIDNSDLDIVCHFSDKEFFKKHLEDCFGNEKGFEISELDRFYTETILAGFELDGFECEIFGQSIPSTEQNGYKHMLIEHQILLQKGETFRQEIIKLKEQGIKTEPAFAKLLQLEGDPYEALLKYKVHLLDQRD